jgi:hypothetical protein
VLSSEHEDWFWGKVEDMTRLVVRREPTSNPEGIASQSPVLATVFWRQHWEQVADYTPTLNGLRRSHASELTDLTSNGATPVGVDIPFAATQGWRQNAGANPGLCYAIPLGLKSDCVTRNHRRIHNTYTTTAA